MMSLLQSIWSAEEGVLDLTGTDENQCYTSLSYERISRPVIVRKECSVRPHCARCNARNSAELYCIS
ncbi:hypothetical protein E2C01_079143 [Portunus trituberculatus]|uniref:Uncharacterized protein n=1 Tax=Portunus trituberculatus TaxID=210409 RepID=A0A5B7IPI1_PORTR|nr:hypothetical protein [Portunus trituberculatus]